MRIKYAHASGGQSSLYTTPSYQDPAWGSWVININEGGQYLWYLPILYLSFKWLLCPTMLYLKCTSFSGEVVRYWGGYRYREEGPWLWHPPEMFSRKLNPEGDFAIVQVPDKKEKSK